MSREDQSSVSFSWPFGLYTCRLSVLFGKVFDSGEQNAEPLLPYYLQVRSRAVESLSAKLTRGSRSTTGCLLQCASQSGTEA